MTTFSYRAKVSRKSDGEIIAYTTVKAESIHEAKKKLVRRFSKRQIVVEIKRGGEFREV